MSLKRSLLAFLSKFGISKFPLRVIIWQVVNENQIELERIDYAKMTVENNLRFYFLKSDVNSVFDVFPYKYLQKNNTVHLIRVGRSNFKPALIHFPAWSELDKASEEKQIRGNIVCEVEGVTESGKPINRLVLEAGDVDLIRNILIHQSNRNYNRFTPNYSVWVQLAPYLTILLTGIAIAIMLYFGLQSEIKTKVICATAFNGTIYTPPNPAPII